MAPRDQTALPLSPSFDRRLLAYALGGGTLALAAPVADAAPVYSGIQNISVTSGGPLGNNPARYTQFHLDPLDNTSPLAEVVFNYHSYNGNSGSDVNVAGVYGGSTSAGALDVLLSADSSLALLAAGDTVGAATPNPKYPKYNAGGTASFYDSTGTWQSSFLHQSGTSYSNWTAGATGYLGFRYLDGGLQRHYGWMELIVPTTSAAGQTATVVQWAYESDANTPIQIPTSNVPEIDPASVGSVASLVVGSLGLLERQLGFAAGAAGLRAWRKRRQAVAV